jgi:Ca-activated chloride channel family protein
VPTNPEILQGVAETSGGTFFTAVDEESLKEVYEELGSRLGKKREDREVTDFFAAGSAMLLLTGGALSAIFFRRVP